MLRPLLLITVLSITACTSLQPRPAASSYACMKAVRDQQPADLPDKRLHCVASAQIARQCSVSEAYLAGIGKELRDLFGSGDPEWADWQADRAGVACRNEDGIAACCERRGF
ncbi:MAG: hypothetical protein QM808_10730 [Steroidobacteraceae bacterium]